MAYHVVVGKQALKEMKNLPEAVRKKFLKILVDLEEYPIPAHRYDVKKLRGEERTYRIRVGKYRLIYEILENTVYILTISHRKSTYKK